VCGPYIWDALPCRAGGKAPKTTDNKRRLNRRIMNLLNLISHSTGRIPEFNRFKTALPRIKLTDPKVGWAKNVIRGPSSVGASKVEAILLDEEAASREPARPPFSVSVGDGKSGGVQAFSRACVIWSLHGQPINRLARVVHLGIRTGR
jgi:hypothetical protein